MKNYPHNVIRIKKGKQNYSKVYWFIVILNKKKQSSQKVKKKLGFYKFGNKHLLSIKGKLLGNYLNKGVLLNASAKKYLYLNAYLI